MAAIVTQDGMPVEGLGVAFSRSISGEPLDYKWTGTTDVDGQVEIDIAADPAGRFWRKGASGYYVARAIHPETGAVVGRWGSIPINGGKGIAISLPIGGRADVNPDPVFATKTVGEAKLGVDDNGRQVDIEEGQIVTIALESNPSTGYRWEVAELREDILRKVGETEFEVESIVPGTPGRETLRFKAVGTGQTTLRLVYHRAWQKGVDPLRTFSVQIVAR